MESNQPPCSRFKECFFQQRSLSNPTTDCPSSPHSLSSDAMTPSSSCSLSEIVELSKTKEGMAAHHNESSSSPPSHSKIKDIWSLAKRRFATHASPSKSHSL
ncbi:hypothetical protein K450DRAFT_238762 [Umbelopsis ramanniana AG]|uniref:Uncharacterized protein n=1 Tax=Umbelopsis ramanniana AG TaxID=1314678 RepID=A0AAD5EBL5_UMBRA|nr:uncharacterized protein K450DRAFT_238762 [Umbelopsis ramanniana AG]KAI8580234.1 hypothetical protein K450DRAFT_238762 [Umbelopsis ramanniana AG]